MKKLAVLLSLGASFVATTASADPITTGVVVVRGRPAKPSVVIEIARSRPGVAITTPTLATVQTTQPATKNDSL